MLFSFFRRFIMLSNQREISEPSVSECTVSVDGYSARLNVLNGLATAGATFPFAHVIIAPLDGDMQTTGGGVSLFSCLHFVDIWFSLAVKMKDAIMSGFSFSVGGNGKPSISISLNYTDMSFETTSTRRR